MLYFKMTKADKSESKIKWIVPWEGKKKKNQFLGIGAQRSIIFFPALLL